MTRKWKYKNKNVDKLVLVSKNNLVAKIALVNKNNLVDKIVLVKIQNSKVNNKIRHWI